MIGPAPVQPMRHYPSAPTDPPQPQSAAHVVQSVLIGLYYVLQDQVPPTMLGGGPMTLEAHLRSVMSLLFHKDEPNNLAFALIQGVVPPLESEIAWLGACMAGADGWVNERIGICPGRERDKGLA
ncbi:hypothetical protein CTheo_6723 [Ceratobasidium theobromae]|uniref:Autophagy protein ATG5 UblB domain-containing protein n=1 Tax=Ceratobasidium theobromae TaxID=1582974 RepID=A0A5N5QEE6_9AGAM|nr:hypothetical protein CTheo_6723 [Ceratobasidium theobromae]